MTSKERAARRARFLKLKEDLGGFVPMARALGHTVDDREYLARRQASGVSKWDRGERAVPDYVDRLICLLLASRKTARRLSAGAQYEDIA